MLRIKDRKNCIEIHNFIPLNINIPFEMANHMFITSMLTLELMRQIKVPIIASFKHNLSSIPLKWI